MKYFYPCIFSPIDNSTYIDQRIKQTFNKSNYSTSGTHILTCMESLRLVYDMILINKCYKKEKLVLFVTVLYSVNITLN